MVAGVDQRVAVPLWSITLAFVFAFQYVLMLPVGVLAHLFLVWVFKNDPLMLDVYFSYSKESNLYDPWPRVDSKRKRPDGFGRDMLC